MITEVVLTESRSLRTQYNERTDVLDKVKALSLLPDDVHATTEIVADYYEVGAEAVASIVKDHRTELEANGRRVITGDELKSFKDLNQIDARRSLAIYNRRAILNVGQLLRDSAVARQVRTYLLDIEETASLKQKNEALRSRVVELEYDINLYRMSEEAEPIRRKKSYDDGVRHGRILAEMDARYGPMWESLEQAVQA